ncbi:amphi-Trp domain-containing protein [Modestobacter marinus]|uniref:amphi-Trp domain-containing protein n=1 Tax=Modestobacter marinus TaxID=477641 RepID=UPI001C988E01|nr:amphi-Trp domain-containing protein [Modestobacter marinus]
MPDVKVQQKQALSRQEAAHFIAALAEGLGEDGKVTVQLGSSTLELSVANQVDWEFEVVVDGDEIELELELKWSMSRRASAEAADDESEEDQSEVDDSEDDESSQNAPAGAGADAPVQDEGEDGAADEGDSGSDVTESVQKVASQSAEPPGASPGVGRDASNGVDSAAVRAWAAANGMTVSPRGRIKAAVLTAYRAAGN